MRLVQRVQVSLPYGFTLFSNDGLVDNDLVWFHYLMDLHYSQTWREDCFLKI